MEVDYVFYCTNMVNHLPMCLDLLDLRRVLDPMCGFLYLGLTEGLVTSRSWVIIGR